MSSQWDVNKGFYFFFGYFNETHNIAQLAEFSSNWELLRQNKDLSATTITSTIPGTNHIKFNGKISQIEFIWDYFSNKVEDLKNFQKGLPNTLMLLTFNEHQFSQKFSNLIENEYTYSINGSDEFQDPYDLYFDEKKGWTTRYWNQKISLPKFNEEIVERVNFGIHIDIRVVRVNKLIRGYTNEGVFHRYKFDGTGAIIDKIKIGFIKYNFDTSLELYVNIGGSQVKRSPMIFCLGSTQINPPFCNINSITVTINKHQDDEFYLVGFAYDEKMGETSRHIVPEIQFEDDDHIIVGSFEYSSSFPVDFPNDYPNFNNDEEAQMIKIFDRFLYFQGTFINSGSDFICKSDSQMDLGVDDATAIPLLCDDGFVSLSSPNRCAKKYDQSISVCEHDMFLQGNKCYKCQFSYGNKNNDVCHKCSENCLTCYGKNHNECLSCKLGFGFNGESCNKCNDASEVFDSINGICVTYKEKFVDLVEENIGNSQIYFRPLEDFADLNVHLTSLFSKIYIKDLTKNYFLTNEYNGLKTHNKVVIDFEIIFIDIDNNDKLMVSIDGKYKYMFNLIENDYDNISEFWADTNYKELKKDIHILAEHVSSDLVIGISAFSEFGKSSYMIRNLKVATFGCHYTCLTCSKDESSLHCLTCENGRFLSVASGRCIACSSNCFTCDNSPFECTSCKIGNFLDNSKKECLDNCPNGFFGDSSQVCQICDTTCLSCMTSSTYCTQCSDPSLFAENGNCVASCSIGKYLEDGKCLDCEAGCNVCLTATNCISCDEGLGFLNQGKTYNI